MGKLFFGHPLRDYTTIKIGGRADCFFEPSSERELIRFLPKLAPDHEIFVLGGGSNTIFGNFKGCVLHTGRLKYASLIEEREAYLLLEVGGGTPLRKLLKLSIVKNLGGLEGLFGVPKITVGGAVAMNAGAYGREMSSVVEKVRYLTYGGEIIEEKPYFGYRSSPFPQKGIILSVLLRLRKADYPVRERIRELNLKRRKKQPLNLPTAGSTFKNPKGHFAGKLLEEVGLKGFCTESGLCFSKKHANFLVNPSQRAAFSDVLRLIETAKERVLKTFNIELEEEVKLVGAD